MRILLTGGTGLLGRALCRRWLADGHRLTVLSRRPARVPERCGATVSALASLADWKPDQTFDALVNLAGEPIIDWPWTLARKQRLHASRIGLTETLSAAIARAEVKPSVLLSASAIGYYGDCGDRPIDENAAAADDFAARLCADWEAVAAGVGGPGLRVCQLRTGLVLSADGGLLARMAPAFRWGLGARLGSGRQWMSWIHIDDWVAAVDFLLTRSDASGAFNLSAPAPVDNAEFTRQLAAHYGRRAPLVAPSGLLRLALGQRAQLLLGGQRVLPARLQALGFHFRHPDLATALAAIQD
ncbi:MAG: TIGR01777 family oxidoreductase [Lysobacterales bacterium]